MAEIQARHKTVGTIQRSILTESFVTFPTATRITFGYRCRDVHPDNVKATVCTRFTEHLDLDFAKHNEQCAPIVKVQLPLHVHDRFLIVDDQVYLLGASVKDMGKGLCAIAQVGFTPEMVLEMMK